MIDEILTKYFPKLMEISPNDSSTPNQESDCYGGYEFTKTINETIEFIAKYGGKYKDGYPYDSSEYNYIDEEFKLTHIYNFGNSMDRSRRKSKFYQIELKSHNSDRTFSIYQSNWEWHYENKIRIDKLHSTLDAPFTQQDLSRIISYLQIKYNEVAQMELVKEKRKMERIATEKLKLGMECNKAIQQFRSNY